MNVSFLILGIDVKPIRLLYIINFKLYRYCYLDIIIQILLLLLILYNRYYIILRQILFKKLIQRNKIKGYSKPNSHKPKHIRILSLQTCQVLDTCPSPSIEIDIFQTKLYTFLTPVQSTKFMLYFRYVCTCVSVCVFVCVSVRDICYQIILLIF